MRNEFFKVFQFSVQTERNFRKGRPGSSEAIVKVEVNIDGKKRVFHEVAEGNGPVNALDNVLRKSLIGCFPRISNVRLVDYCVHGDSDGGTKASVEVVIRSSDGRKEWVTKGISHNIIEASLFALTKSLRKEIKHTCHISRRSV